MKAVVILLKTLTNKYSVQTIKSELIKLGLELAQDAIRDTLSDGAVSKDSTAATKTPPEAGSATERYDIALTPFLGSLVYHAGAADLKALRMSPCRPYFTWRIDPDGAGM